MSRFGNGQFLVDTFEGATALYAFCADYHSGQWSRGYRLLCRLGKRLKLSPLWEGYESLEEDEREIYDELVEKYADSV